MAGGSNDAVKIGLLLGALVAVIGFIGYTFLNRTQQAPAPAPVPAVASPGGAPPAGDAAAQPGPAAPIALEPFPNPVNPFRETVATSSPTNGTAGSVRSAPTSQIGGTSFGDATGITPLPGTAPMSVTPPASFGFRLDGVVVGRRPGALLSYNGQTKLLSPGESLAGVQVLEIQANGIRVRVDKKVMFVKVGEGLGGPSEFRQN